MPRLRFRLADKEYDAGGGNLDPIPDKTNCGLSIDSAVWKTDKDDNEYLNIQYSVVKPDAYANRKIFQKLWVKDGDPRAKDQSAKRDKALRMLATIDAICGGKLAKAGGEPSDDDLALALTNKQLVGKVMVWEMEGSDGNTMSGNWIAHVAAKGGSLTISEVAAPKKKADPEPDYDDLEDDIPFN